MNKDEKYISEHYKLLNESWNSKYERPSKLLEVHSKYEALNRVTEFFDFIQHNVYSVDRVAIMATSDPVGLCFLFRKYYDSKIKIVSDHPLLDRTGWYYRQIHDAEVIDVNPMFEDVTSVLEDCDLVVFPEYEFFAPLSLVKPYGDKLTAALHYVIWPCPGNSTFKVESVDDLTENLSFKKLVARGSYKNVDRKSGYYALGFR